MKEQHLERKNRLHMRYSFGYFNQQFDANKSQMLQVLMYTKPNLYRDIEKHLIWRRFYISEMLENSRGN